MKKLLTDQRGVTLIETVVATAIISIIMVTILGALLFGQKVIVFSDVKNNEAAQAQNLIDEIMKPLSGGTLPVNLAITGATQMIGTFNDTLKTTSPKQYYVVPVKADMTTAVSGAEVGYKIYVRVYYDNGNSQINYTAFTKKGGVWS